MIRNERRGGTGGGRGRRGVAPWLRVFYFPASHFVVGVVDGGKVGIREC